MKLREQVIDEEQTAFGCLRLIQYAQEGGESGYAVYIGDSFLMATHGARGEVFMARMAYERLAKRDDIRVLIGGLGAGHTLRAVLDLAGVRSAEVAEIGAKVVEWNRRYFASSNGDALKDPRVAVHVEPLQQTLSRERSRYDLLLIDVDNGPGWLAAEANQALYAPVGLAECRAALSAGGVLAIWSPDPNAVLRDHLQALFTHVEQLDTQHLGGDEQAINDVVLLAYD